MTTRRKWSSPEAREIASSVGMKDPDLAVRTLARRVWSEHGDGSIPVHLSALFKWANIRRVVPEEMPLDGALRRLTNGNFDIVVRESASSTRRRFSVAHELGHVLFYHHAPLSKAAQAAARRRAPAEEERLCNIVAEELLMPAATVERVLRESASVDRILQLAADCHVSIEAALFRLAPAWGDRKGEIQLWRKASRWELSLRRRLGTTRTSLASFEVDEWGGHAVPSSEARWHGETVLNSRARRMTMNATTTVVPIGRHVPTLLVVHEYKTAAHMRPDDELVRAARRRAATRDMRARNGSPQKDCPSCQGSGYLVPSIEGYPANRCEPTRLCECRLISSRASSGRAVA